MPALSTDPRRLHDARLQREIVRTWIGLAITSVASVLVAHDVLRILWPAAQNGPAWKVVEQCVYVAIVTGLVYGNYVYQVARLGYLERRRVHRPAAAADLDTIYTRDDPDPIVILIPSYKEEWRVIRQAILSAALQTYPSRRVVLLIDDPPHPKDVYEAERLTATRNCVRDVDARLAAEARHYRWAASAFAARRHTGLDLRQEARRLQQEYVRVERWFARQAATHVDWDHTDRLFVDLVLGSRVREYRQRAAALARRASAAEPAVDAEALAREYRRLVAVFDVRVSSFERKRYANLSHEPNKAMNLNSYIGLMGRAFRIVDEAGGTKLVPDASATATFRVDDAKYLITLDADSLLHPDYALRLAQVMEQPGNERLGVVQTPYSAVPGAPGVLERLAGATTDMQYLVHQGFTHHGATFWVGANAMLRKRALEAICTRQRCHGHEVARFIQDRTVIEDTESSLDLVRQGWQLYNYPDRLSYSATPPDFGALVVQRQRWANGGLLIVPKLVRHLVAAPCSLRSLREGWLRLHYLVSIAWVNSGLVLALLYPFEDNLRCVWLPLTAVPYLYLYGRDLRAFGYGWSDLLRVQALNLMLVPVNLSGVGRSLCQVLTGHKSPFNRTPKVQGRTTTPRSLLVMEYGILLYAGIGIFVDSWHGRWLHALLGAGTFLCFLYAMVRFIGVREAWADLRGCGRGRQEAQHSSDPLPMRVDEAAA